MEVLSFSTRNKCQILSGFPTFHPIKALNQKIPLKRNKLNSRFSRNKFPIYLSTCRTRKFQTWAQFGHPTSRRNSLRKKLLDDQQVSLNQNLSDSISEIQKTSSSSNDFSILGENSSYNALELEERGVSVDGIVENVSIERKKSKLFGESVLFSKLENWVDQYKKDIEYWGIGSGPIFMVYQDSSGSVKKVLVDEEEILRRSRVQREEIKDFPEVNHKILSAKSIAMEMENGNNVIPRNSSIAKFVVQGEEAGFLKAMQGFTTQPRLLPKLSGVGSRVLCVLVIFWAVKKLFTSGGREDECTEMEKEMMRRKIKSRKEKETLMKGAVEVMPKPSEPPDVYMEKPKLDREALTNRILKAKTSADKLVVHNLSAEVTTISFDTDNKIREIRDMARQAREIEAKDHSLVSGDQEMDDLVVEESHDEMEGVKKHIKDTSLSNLQNDVVGQLIDINASLETTSTDITEHSDNAFLHEVVPAGELNLHASTALVSDDRIINKQVIESNEITVHLKDKEDSKPSDTSTDGSCMPKENDINKKPRVIRSVKAARDYLLKKNDKQEPDTESKFNYGKENVSDLKSPTGIGFSWQKSQVLKVNTRMSRNRTSAGTSDSNPSRNACDDFHMKNEGIDLSKNDGSEGFGIKSQVEDSQKSQNSLGHDINGFIVETRLSSMTENGCSEDFVVKNGVGDPQTSQESVDHKVNDVSAEKRLSFWTERSEDPINNGIGDSQKSDISLDHEANGVNKEKSVSAKIEKWLDKNFHEVEPIIRKMRAGFRDNYMVARERVNQPLDINTEIEPLQIDEDGGELDWMQDEHLRDIVFQVRDNELAGRDPFYLINSEDKEAFFRGLEKKVEKENKKLSHLHEWLHSNIENLDYGADGISIYDPPQKIIPRWKGPPVEKIPEFLNDFLEQRKATSARSIDPVNKDVNGIAQKPTQLSSHENSSDPKNSHTKNIKSSKTVIEGSDGSVKAGKKSGKEYWQHTKKWSRGFLESYNAETDPEIKSTMREIGKDLDRWITEKEIKEAADLMNKLPDKSRSVIEKKLNKLKREMELFGPQAVVSKYREYADDKEEDYLWWLDLSYILCIEMYTVDDGKQRVGFYSLEMASDLELEPKPYHVIAFQDAGDCKNLCYIIQAHMEMLGRGHAFVVARPPKDAFREAKANGFGVTVIRKGELQLNIDQPLEEVEEQITEIGSKIYHDMIMKERSVDINSIMKGVLGFNRNPTRSKKLMQKLKKLKRRRKK